jgi:hypothetical protein
MLLLLQAFTRPFSSHSSCNPPLKMPWKNYKTQTLEKNNGGVCRKTKAAPLASFLTLLAILVSRCPEISMTHEHLKKRAMVKFVEIQMWRERELTSRKKLVGFQWAGLSGELSLSGRDNSAWDSVHAESWHKNQFPTQLKRLLGSGVVSCTTSCKSAKHGVPIPCYPNFTHNSMIVGYC